MNIGRRIQIHGPVRVPGRAPGFARSKAIEYGHACDEFGNCSVYLTLGALGGIVIFWEPPSHYQTGIELPAPGQCPWIDKRYYS